MWRFLTVLLAEILAYAMLSSAQDCGINLPGLILPQFAPRIVPVVSEDGLLLVWQDGGSINLRRFGSGCNQIGQTIKVNSSEDFFSNPGSSGLSDAVSIGRGATVVTWTLGGDVWTRVVLTQDSTVDLSPVVRVNGASRHSRAQARVTPSPNSGFVIAWSSWQQDGDGWGVFARPFTKDAKPETEELQVNQYWKHFQWHPQLKWCGSSLWALFANSSGECSEGMGCSTGPFLRRIAVSGNESWEKDMRDEINLQGKGPIAAALTCSIIESDNATAYLWVNGGREVEAQEVSPESSGRSNGSSAGTGTGTGGRSVYEGSEAGLLTSLSRGQGRTTHLAASLLKQSPDGVSTIARRLQNFLGREDNYFSGQADTASEVEALQSFVGAAEGSFIGVGEVGMIAHSGIVLLLTNTRSGTLYAQLLQFGHRAPLAFPQHKISSGVQSVRAVWDSEGANLMLVLCWTSGSVLQSDPSGFYCIRVSASKLVDSDPFQLDANLAILLMISVVATVCCIRQCSRAAVRRHGLGNIRQRAMANARREAESAASQARVRELQQQLSRIPERPPTFQMAGSPLDGTSGREGSGRAGTAVQPSDASAQLQDTDSQGRSQDDSGSIDSIQWARSQNGSSDVCSICQNDVVMWVALQPCGHTACRHCIMRIVEMNQRCHICRGGIEGVLPVYI